MSNTTVLCTRNYLDSTYLPVKIAGGSWVMPLSNMATDNLSTEVARSNGLTLTNTTFEIAFRQLVDITVSAIPIHNLKNQSRYRVRYSASDAWEGALVAASGAIGATSFTIAATSSALNLEAGQSLKFAGHEQPYTITTTTIVPAGANSLIFLTEPLVAEITPAEVIECLSGDYTTPVYDSGWNDGLPTIYPSMTPYWGHPSFWDGKPSAEDLSRERYPIIIIHDSIKLIKYQRWEFDDTTNTDGYIEIPRVFVSYGKQPSFNCVWGSTHGLKSDTTYKETRNGRRVYDVRPTKRVNNLIFPDLPANEVYSSFFDDLRSQGKHGQMFVVFDPTDVAHLHRRSMLATVEELPTISYDYHGGGINGQTYTAVSLSFQFTEVVA